MTVLVIALNVLAAIGFSAAMIRTVWTRSPALSGAARLFLCLALLTCLFTSISNVLEHTGRTGALDVFEDYSEILFVPFSLSFIHALWTRQELNRRRRVERQLAHERYLLHAIMDNVPDQIFFKDADGRFTRVSEAMADSFGLNDPSEAIGRTDGDFRAAEHARQALEDEREVMRTGRALVGKEEKETWPDGRTTWASTTKLPLRDDEGEIVGTFGISRDVTERRKMEQRLREAQKMEAIGRLAGGIAHDFNNQLTIVRGYCELLLRDPALDGETRRSVEEISHAAQRSATLTSRLLAFSRKQILRPRVINLNDVIARMAEPLGRMIGEDIDLSIVAADGLGNVEVDLAQFEQALMNLAVNARDAMPDGGSLTMETANVELDGDHAGAAAGPHVRFTVRDTGVGMDERTRRRVFEPFFTTKPVGQGTGLGLAMVYGFVTQSGGRVYVRSRPGEGAAFEIYLPLVDRPADPPAVEGQTDSLLRGSETVLVAEDDPAVRHLVVRVLRKQGYVVLEAAGGKEAVPLGEHYEGRIDLLVTDVVMPAVGGPELAERLRAVRPDMPVLYVSGYADNTTIGEGGAGADPAHLLHKPFAPAELVASVRRLLDETRLTSPAD